MSRILLLLSVVLVAFHAQCVAACSVLPCAEQARHSAPASEPPCHHHSQPPSGAQSTQACGHSHSASEDGMRIAPPALELVSFEPVPMFVPALPLLEAGDVAVLSPPPPLSSASLSRAILRV